MVEFRSLGSVVRGSKVEQSRCNISKMEMI